MAPSVARSHSSEGCGSRGFGRWGGSSVGSSTVTPNFASGRRHVRERSVQRSCSNEYREAPPCYGEGHGTWGGKENLVYTAKKFVQLPERRETVARKAKKGDTVVRTCQGSPEHVRRLKMAKVVEKEREKSVERARHERMAHEDRVKTAYDLEQKARRARDHARYLQQQVQLKKEKEMIDSHMEAAVSHTTTLTITPEAPQEVGVSAKRMVAPPVAEKFSEQPSRRKRVDMSCERARTLSASPPRRKVVPEPIPDTHRAPYDTFIENPAYPTLAATGERNKFCHPLKRHASPPHPTPHRSGRRIPNHHQPTMGTILASTPAPASRRSHSSTPMSTRPW